MSRQQYINDKIEEWKSKNPSLSDISKSGWVPTKSEERSTDMLYEKKKLVFPFMYFSKPHSSSNIDVNYKIEITQCSVSYENRNPLLIGNFNYYSPELLLSNNLFEQDVEFKNIIVNQQASLIDNSFEQKVYFSDIETKGIFNLENSVFAKEVTFSQCTFHENIKLSNAIFGAKVTFKKCTFKKGVTITRKDSKVDYSSDARLPDEFQIDELIFDSCNFESKVDLSYRYINNLQFIDCQSDSGELILRRVEITDSFVLKNEYRFDRKLLFKFDTTRLVIANLIRFENITIGQELCITPDERLEVRIEKSNFDSKLSFGNEDEGSSLKKISIENSTFNELVVMRNVSFSEEPKFRNSQFNGGLDLSMDQKRVGGNE